MNILLINHYAGSPRHGMEFRPFYLAREWVRDGHRVQIIAGSFSHIRAVQPDCVERVLEEEIEGVDYRWYRTPAYSGNGIGRVKNMLSFVWALWSGASEIASQFKPDIVIASSTYPMDIWPARRIARLARAKLVFEVHDLWPLSPMELGGMSRWHPFIVWVQWAEDFAYRHADVVVSMLPKAKEHMCSRGMDPDKFVYVPNGVDLGDWDNPEALSPQIMVALTKLKANGLPIVGYTGTYGLANALDVLLDAAKLLAGKATIVLVGKGPEGERLAARVGQEELDNVQIFSSIPKRAMPSLLDQLDIAYIGLLPHPLFRFGISPNKLMDYMIAGKPIILSAKTGNDPVREAGCGITVPPGNPSAVARAVLDLVGISQEERQAIGLAGREHILEYQTYAVLAQQFLQSPGSTNYGRS